MDQSPERTERKSANVTEEQWKTLGDEWCHAVMLYQMYEGLFASAKTRTLLNAVDGQLFATIQRELFFSLVMHMTRITDDDKRGRVTLTLLGTDVAEQRKLTNSAKAATKNLRTLRNSRLAHLVPLKEVKPVYLKEIRETLVIVWKALECYSLRERDAGIWPPLGIDEPSRKADPISLCSLSLPRILEDLIDGLSWATQEWPERVREVFERCKDDDEAVFALRILYRVRRLRSEIDPDCPPYLFEGEY